MIHPTSIISSYAVLEEGVQVGPYSIIHDNVILRKNTVIGAYCEIGLPTHLANIQKLEIGESSIIRSHSVIYCGSIIGSNFTTGHHICVRENSLISDGVQLGSRGDIQGDCSIGPYTKMHADVHVGKKSKIGKFVWLFPEVLLTNDPMPPSEMLVGAEIGDYAVLASKALVLPGVKIGGDVVVSAGSVVKSNISDGKLAAGNPAKEMCDVRILRMPDNPKVKAYPWRHRFNRGYPQVIIDQWLAEFSSVGKST